MNLRVLGCLWVWLGAAGCTADFLIGEEPEGSTGAATGGDTATTTTAGDSPEGEAAATQDADADPTQGDATEDDGADDADDGKESTDGTSTSEGESVGEEGGPGDGPGDESAGDACADLEQAPCTEQPGCVWVGRGDTGMCVPDCVDEVGCGELTEKACFSAENCTWQREPGTCAPTQCI